MSDISLSFEWSKRLIASPVVGWPGLLAGGALGVALWPKRRLLGGALDHQARFPNRAR